MNDVKVTGMRALALLAEQTITIESGATLDVSAQRGTPGPGAQVCTQVVATNGQGGAGGSFGSDGGPGGGGGSNPAEVPPGPPSDPITLQGGCTRGRRRARGGDDGAADQPVGVAAVPCCCSPAPASR